MSFHHFNVNLFIYITYSQIVCRVFKVYILKEVLTRYIWSTYDLTLWLIYLSLFTCCKCSSPVREILFQLIFSFVRYHMKLHKDNLSYMIADAVSRPMKLKVSCHLCISLQRVYHLKLNFNKTHLRMPILFLFFNLLAI